MARPDQKPKGRRFITDGIMALHKDGRITVDGHALVDIMAVQLGEQWRSDRIGLGKVRIWIERI